MDGLTLPWSAPGVAPLGVTDLLLRLLIAWLAGQAVGWVYSSSHGSVSYSQGFAQSAVLLSMVVALLMTIVGDSLARAFGLGAALAIVRFRTPVKDVRDATLLFLAVAAGMAAGVGLGWLALVGTTTVGGVALLLQWGAFGSRFGDEAVLRLHYLGDDPGRMALAGVLKRHCTTFELQAVRVVHSGAAEELVYDVTVREEGEADALVRELVMTPGVSGVSLLPHARAGES